MEKCMGKPISDRKKWLGLTEKKKSMQHTHTHPTYFPTNRRKLLLMEENLSRARGEKNVFYFLVNFCWYFYIFLPLPPLRGQPAFIMPTLQAPQQGMTCPCRLEMPDSNPGLQVLPGLRIRSIFGRIRILQIRIFKPDPGSCFLKYWPLL